MNPIKLKMDMQIQIAKNINREIEYLILSVKDYHELGLKTYRDIPIIYTEYQKDDVVSKALKD